MSIRTLSTVALALGLATACAPGTGGQAPSPSDGVTTISVIHDVRSATSLTVFLVTPTRAERRLGVVRPGSVERFEFTDPPISGQYRLIARLSNGRTYTSREFILLGRDGVEWSPGDNIVSPISRN